MTERYDAIVIGAGHNGLVCAIRLAQSGKRVLLLEAANRVGGLAVTEEFHDGFWVSTGAQLLHQLQPAVMKAIGVRVPSVVERMATVVLAEDGDHVRLLDNDVSGPASGEAAAFAEFRQLGLRLARFLNQQFLRRPPRFDGDTRRLARLGLGLRLLGKADMRELLRLVGQNMHDEVNARFSHPLLKAAVCLDAVTGTHTGPRSPGSVVTWLHRLAGQDGAVSQPAGGVGAVSEALAARAVKLGVELRTGQPVDRIVVDNGRVAGVESGGERFESWTVISNADPKTTVQRLVGERHFETSYLKRIHHYRSDGNVAKLHLALDGLPEAAGLDDTDFQSRLLIAPGEDAIEAAFNPAKYGEFSADPVMEISLPSAADDRCAPEGQHVLSAIVQYAPYRLAGGWTDDARDRFTDLCLQTLSRYFPDISRRVVALELMTPVDIEHRFGVYGGHWHHGEIGLDQFMFTRPVVGASQYRQPLDGLWLCGAGTHPGGGVSGAPGYNAAEAILELEQRR
ncbi:MAG: NAD(P)/FAD-dependent oxidoreductase [Pseudomonadota bacterium]